MPLTQRPDAIDTRLVFRIYACAAVALGCALYFWQPVAVDATAGHPAIVLGIAGALVWAFASYAAALARVEDPVGRHSGLKEFAVGHLLVSVFLWNVWSQGRQLHDLPFGGPTMSPVVWAPFMIGLVLLYLAYTASPASGFKMTVQSGSVGPDGRPRMMAVREKQASVRQLRSQYEAQIRQAARQEERVRLARDLHDGIRQQLFVIQTAAATAEARFDTDAAGARAAVQQVRAAAREAMGELEAMFEQIEATPIENIALVESLKKQCEALGFRTGAAVTFDHDRLPPATLLPPGAQLAMFRLAQEALANIGRHARARHVAVRLFTRKRQLVLEVVDDGVGFDPIGAPRGMGIANMQARAAEIGGDLTLTSAPEAGTTVRFAIPYQASSPLTYGMLAAMFALLFAGVGALQLRDGLAPEPVRLTLIAIGAVGLARYGMALYRVRRALAGV